MIWVGWREQRTETLIALGILAVIAVILVPTGIEIAHAYHHDGIAACLGAHTSRECGGIVSAFQDRWSSISGLLGWLTLLPGIIGVLLAAPFITQLENGTYRLDWTQSITRRRWIAGKLGLAVGVAVVLSIALIALVTWWRAPLVRVSGRMDNAAFDSEGIVAVSYTLFALGLALAVGVIWRRAVAALMVAFVGYFAVRVWVDTWLRQRLVTPHTLTWPARQDDPAVLNHAWVISRSVVSIGPPPTNCSGFKGCFFAHAKMTAVFQPPSNFWPLQLTEFGMFAAVAVALIALAAWWTARRA